MAMAQLLVQFRAEIAIARHICLSSKKRGISNAYNSICKEGKVTPTLKEPQPSLAVPE